VLVRFVTRYDEDTAREVFRRAQNCIILRVGKGK